MRRQALPRFAMPSAARGAFPDAPPCEPAPGRIGRRGPFWPAVLASRSGQRRNPFCGREVAEPKGGGARTNKQTVTWGSVRAPKRVRSTDEQADLFPRTAALPTGLSYQRDFITSQSEDALLQRLGMLPFKEFEFHGFKGKRRVVWFGWRYDFNGGGLRKTDVGLPS